jgi:uncharacterized protein involved in response to NO
MLGVDLVLLLSTIILGRVLPMFTRNTTGVASIRSIPLLDKCAIGSVAAREHFEKAGAQEGKL